MARFSRPVPVVDHAATTALRYALSAIRCAATLLVTGAATERDRNLGVALLKAANTAERALHRLGRAADARGDGGGTSLN